MSTHLQHFGLRYTPLSANTKKFWVSPELEKLRDSFQSLLNHPGVGVLTGASGVGKTAALREFIKPQSEDDYCFIYHSETDFGRVDIYRQLAVELGLEPSYRRADLWRALKTQIQDMNKNHHTLPVWIIDEAQNLPPNFFRDLPSFINFAFDREQLITIWLVGLSGLTNLLKKPAYKSMHSRVLTFNEIRGIENIETFKKVVNEAFKDAGATSTLLSEQEINKIFLASSGNLRVAGQLILKALQLATQKNYNHLPAEVVDEALESRKLSQL